jgi:uncharacterized protein YdiU (UPF0061 family)
VRGYAKVMNPIIKKRLETLQKQVQDLESLFLAVEERSKRHLEDRERAQEEQWRSRKELSTLRRVADDYDALLEESESYRNERQTLRSTLETILKRTRALRTEYTK